MQYPNVRITESNVDSKFHVLWIHFNKNDYFNVCSEMEKSGLDVKVESYTLNTRVHCGASNSDGLLEILGIFENA